MKEDDKTRIAAGLGASRVVDVAQTSIGGPLDMLALRLELNERLQSSGGRPTDPSWKVSRQVPFKEESWSQLQDIAAEVGASGKRVGPAQVAALLVENSLAELDAARWQETLDQSRTIPLLSEPDAAEAAGVTYEQFDDWVQRQWLIPAARSGRRQSFGADEIMRASWLRFIRSTSTELDRVIGDIRSCDLTERYLVVTSADTVRTAASRTQLYRLLEEPGSHLVIDQLPERRKLIGLPPLPEDGHDERPIQQAV